MVCAELMLDGEVIALQRMILGESDKFPEIAETFYKRRSGARRARWQMAEAPAEARPDRARRCR